MVGRLKTSRSLGGGFGTGLNLRTRVSGQSVAPSLLDGLIADWELQEASGARTDSHGENDLTDNATVTQAAGPAGTGFAAAFAAANSEYLSVSSNDALRTGDIAFTWEMWVYITSKASSRYLIGKRASASSGMEYQAYYSSVSDRFGFAVSGDGTISTGATSVLADNLGSPAINTWYHLLFWHDPDANQIGIRVNGGTANTAAHATGVYLGTAPLYVGNGWLGASTLYHDGRLAYMRLWKQILDNDAQTWLASAPRTYAEVSAYPN